jgi:hypothetical protein
MPVKDEIEDKPEEPKKKENFSGDVGIGLSEEQRVFADSFIFSGGKIPLKTEVKQIAGKNDGAW